jgi:hypothetical protein
VSLGAGRRPEERTGDNPARARSTIPPSVDTIFIDINALVTLTQVKSFRRNYTLAHECGHFLLDGGDSRREAAEFLHQTFTEFAFNERTLANPGYDDFEGFVAQILQALRGQRRYNRNFPPAGNQTGTLITSPTVLLCRHIFDRTKRAPTKPARFIFQAHTAQEALDLNVKRVTFLRRQFSSLQATKAMLQSRLQQLRTSVSGKARSPSRHLVSSCHVTRGPNLAWMTSSPVIRGESLAQA